jgi:hypothetical protein
VEPPRLASVLLEKGGDAMSSKTMAEHNHPNDQPDQNPRHAAEIEKKKISRDAAALRSEPEDRRASARQTTPAGKGRSK